MQSRQQFSFRARTESIRHAWEGIRNFFAAEHNAIVHLFATVGVIILSAVLGVTSMEAIALLIVTGMVWAAELFNTAIEKIMDYISSEKQPAIKYIKDLAAAAVLVAAVTALLTGFLIFYPKILLLW